MPLNTGTFRKIPELSNDGFSHAHFIVFGLTPNRVFAPSLLSTHNHNTRLFIRKIPVLNPRHWIIFLFPSVSSGSGNSVYLLQLSIESEAPQGPSTDAEGLGKQVWAPGFPTRYQDKRGKATKFPDLIQRQRKQGLLSAASTRAPKFTYIGFPCTVQMLTLEFICRTRISFTHPSTIYKTATLCRLRRS